MLFNSLDFAIFLPMVFGLYWFVTQRNLKQQNLLILVSSYVFYGWWDWRFLSLIAISTLADFGLGLALGRENNPVKRKWFVAASVVVNIGFLAFFKYFNFFVESFTQAFSFMGTEIDGYTLNIILLVGISFYTFQTLSYTIDVYRKKIEPTNNLVAFGAFVAFFPQLVAGPIERASNLLPQFFEKRRFDYSKAADGMRQILWGFFKKVVVADSCGKFADLIFDNSANYGGSTLVLGAIFFAFQIYGDFSGYSDIAIGTARLFGFNLKQNFNFPYFSRDVAEFWRRWHISLSTWFRDYLYIPLGGSKGGTLLKTRNIAIVFLVSGLWHGAAWKFIIWGALHALYILPLVFLNKNRRNLNTVAEGTLLPSLWQLVSMLVTFCLVTLAWVFFRAHSVQHAVEYILNIFSSSLFTVPHLAGKSEVLLILLLITSLVAVEWGGRKWPFALAYLSPHRWLRWLIYYLLVMGIVLFGKDGEQFIYFQF